MTATAAGRRLASADSPAGPAHNRRNLMNWKTRVLAVAAAAIVVAGCGSKGSDQNQPAASQSTSKPAAKEEKSDIQVTFETVSAPAPTEAKELKGAGATFPVPLYKAWNNAYKNTIGVSVVYEGVGS